MTQAIKVKRLVLYPVKSMSGIDVPYLQCTSSGFLYDGVGDRHWIVSTANGIGLSGRQQPRLALVKPSIHGNMLHLDADGMATLKIPRDITADDREKKSVDMYYVGTAKGLDCGDAAGQWLSKFLGKEGLRLLHAEQVSDGLSLKDCRLTAPLATSENDGIVYHDGFAGMLLSETSLEDLNSRLQKPVNMNRFRGNIIVSGSEVPYVEVETFGYFTRLLLAGAVFGPARFEDDWKQVRIGETIFIVPVIAPRCHFATVDPNTGVQDKEPIRTLKKYRIFPLPESLQMFKDHPCFGIWLTTQKPGIIRVGDTIMATKEPAC